MFPWAAGLGGRWNRRKYPHPSRNSRAMSFPVGSSPRGCPARVPSEQALVELPARALLVRRARQPGPHRTSRPVAPRGGRARDASTLAAIALIALRPVFALYEHVHPDRAGGRSPDHRRLGARVARRARRDGLPRPSPAERRRRSPPREWVAPSRARPSRRRRPERGKFENVRYDARFAARLLSSPAMKVGCRERRPISLRRLASTYPPRSCARLLRPLSTDGDNRVRASGANVIRFPQQS
jgi:hypothetical protein